MTDLDRLHATAREAVARAACALQDHGLPEHARRIFDGRARLLASPPIAHLQALADEGLAPSVALACADAAAACEALAGALALGAARRRARDPEWAEMAVWFE